MRLRVLAVAAVLALGTAVGVSAASQLTGAGFAPVAAPGPSVGPQGASTRYSVGDGRGAVDPGNGNHDGLSSSPLEGSPAKAPATVLLPPYPAADVEESVGGTLELPAAASSDTGYATWCAPTPTHCQGWGGNVLVGAVQSFSYGDRPYTVTVWRGSRHVSVRVISHCACGNRAGRPTLIDLSPAAFTRLAPLAAGVIEVRLVGGGAVERPLPATNTGP